MLTYCRTLLLQHVGNINPMFEIDKGTRPKTISGLVRRNLNFSSHAMATNAGPSVINKKSSEGGYFVTFRKESTIKIDDA